MADTASGIITYRKMLEQGFAEVKTWAGIAAAPRTRLEYLSEYIFQFTAYDSEQDEFFASIALDVCAAINTNSTQDYIKDPERYRWYLAMVNMAFFAGRIDWGTSIRGAWWGSLPDEKIKFQSSGLFLDGKQLHEEMEFTTDQWRTFIVALLSFGAQPES